MGPVFAADPSGAQQLEVRLIGQSGGFKAFAGLTAPEVPASDSSQFRIHKIQQAVQGVLITIVPSRKHYGDIVRVLVCHAAEILSKKFTTH
jgi:hypothetical protein